MSTRRQFCQFMGSAIGSIALTQLNSFNQTANLLAQPSQGKYALLIGIDDYDIKPLNGCNTDIDLQRALLIHRYGFHPKNIIELRDRQASYQNIINTFQTHLIQQAKPGDLVVFHFSGHGSRVHDRQAIPEFVWNGIGLNGTIVPIDGQTLNSQEVRQIMGKTLFLLSSQLKTDNVVMILDCCHSEGGLRGNAKVRSLDARMNSSNDSANLFPNVVKEELQLQTQLQKALGWTDEQLQQRRQQGAAKGVAMGAASFDKIADVVDLTALELSQNGFSAGAFTYLLTRYLWQVMGGRSLAESFSQLLLSSTLYSNNPEQYPVYQVAPNSNNQQKPIFFTSSATIAADGVIHKPPKGNEVEFLLSGVTPDSLRAYEKAVFNLLDRNGKILGEVQQTRRSGLIGYGISTVTPQEGLLLREKVRGIPNNLMLKVGLHDSLGSDLPKIQQGLSTLPQLEIVPIATQQEIHYIIGQENKSPTRKWQILNPTLESLPGAIDASTDTTKTKIDLLRRRLRTLQAKQLLKTMMGDAVTIKMGVDLIPVTIVNSETKESRPNGPPQTVMSQAAIVTNPEMVTHSPKFAPNTSVQLRLKNQETKALYMAVMVISRDGSLAVAYPYAIDAPIDEALVAKQSEKILPFPFKMRSTAGMFELLLIASRRPLNKLLATVQNIADERGSGLRGSPMVLEADRSIEFATEMLAELDDISRDFRSYLPGRRVVDMNQLAVVSTIVQIE